ncbi:MAG TPA: YmfQ family protein [Firmicutes bacterium]|nr:YmfQ family protein [Bacillota bacterium]
MTHIDHLIDLLRPLGVYDLSGGKRNREELEAYGRQLDQGLGELEETAREMSLVTAESFGLELVEALLPYRPVSTTLAERRQALAALLRIGGDSFTLRAVNDTLAGCGINAQAEETGRPGCVEVFFPDVIGIPEDFAQLRRIMEEILPCHLEISYRFWYNSWAQVAQRVSTWGETQAAGKSWYGLAVWQE